jgi:hypothetical protein
METALKTQDEQQLLVQNGIPPFLSNALKTMEGVMSVVQLMAKSGTIPSHLQGKDKEGDLFRVVLMAVTWGMNPYAVADCTSLVHGRMCYEGKLVSAVLMATKAIKGRLSYKVEGEGQGAKITVSGTVNGSNEIQSITGTVKEWRTTTKSKDGGQVIPNGWDKDPISMLHYRGTRQFARLFCPEAMLGIFTPDEIEHETQLHEGTDFRIIPETKPVEKQGTVEKQETPRGRVGKAQTKAQEPAQEQPKDQGGTKAPDKAQEQPKAQETAQEQPKTQANKPNMPCVEAGKAFWLAMNAFTKNDMDSEIERKSKNNCNYVLVTRCAKLHGSPAPDHLPKDVPESSTAAFLKDIKTMADDLENADAHLCEWEAISEQAK